MDYLLTEEQKMLREMVDNFGKDNILPVASKIDEEDAFPHDLVKQIGELGLMGIAYPEEYGGAGMDSISYMLAVEGLSRYSAAIGVIVSAHTSLAVDPIFTYGTEEQKKKYLPALCSGEHIGCYALTEPNAGSDAAHIRTRAELKGDTWVLNGSKTFITNGKEAKIAVVFAVTDPEKGHKGISAFIVETDTPGFKVGKLEKKLGIKGSSTAEIILEDCAIPKENLLGEVGQGFKIAVLTLDGGRLGIASQALGIARAAIEDAIAYSKERVQFGKPIAEFQGLKWYMAEMATEYDAAWLLTWRASKMKDMGIPYYKEASMAKWKASEVAELCASKAIQIHGGYGYIKEFNPERYYRDAKITQIYEGTSEIQKEIISHWLLK
ncbi:MAG: acyl-CoA dehydrogenase AcdA [Calditrichia bacterium]